MHWAVHALPFSPSPPSPPLLQVHPGEILRALKVSTQQRSSLSHVVFPQIPSILMYLVCVHCICGQCLLSRCLRELKCVLVGLSDLESPLMARGPYFDDSQSDIFGIHRSSITWELGKHEKKKNPGSHPSPDETGWAQ